MAVQIVDVNGNPFLTDVVSQAQAIGSLNAAVTSQLRGQTTATVQVTAIGSQTLTFEGTTDNTNWYTLNAFPIAGGAPVTTTTTTGQWRVDIAGMFQFRVRCSAYTSGSATTSVVCSQGESPGASNGTAVAIASTTAGQVGPLIQGAVTTAAPAYTTAQTDPLSLTTAGALRTDINSIIGTTAVAASAGVLKVGASGATGATMDSVTTAATTPANALAVSVANVTTAPSLATGQSVALQGDYVGSVFVKPYRRSQQGIQATTISATGATTIVTAGAAGIFNDIASIVITTAGLAAQTITISDGTVSWIIDYPNAAVAPGTPFVANFDPPLKATTAATAWTANQSAATTCHYLVNYVTQKAS